MRIYTSKAREMPFFERCLDAGFKEGEDKVIRLPEDNPRAVEMLLEHFVLDLLPSSARIVYKFQVTPDEVGPIMVDLYMLADKLGAESFQNAVVDHVRVLFREDFIPPECLEMLMDVGLSKSKLYEMLLAEFAYEIREFLLGTMGEEQRIVVDAWFEGGGRVVKELIYHVVQERKSLEELGPCGGGKVSDYCKWHTHLSTPACVKLPRVLDGDESDDEGEDKLVGDQKTGSFNVSTNCSTTKLYRYL
jgi:hypothetical protein